MFVFVLLLTSCFYYNFVIVYTLSILKTLSLNTGSRKAKVESDCLSLSPDSKLGKWFLNQI